MLQRDFKFLVTQRIPIRNTDWMGVTLQNVPRENDLARRARGGDREALEALTRRFYPSVRAFLGRLVKPQDAEDITQDVFLKLMRSLGTYNSDCRFSTWLFRVALNRARDVLKRQRPADLVLPEAASQPLISREEDLEKLFKAVRTLPGELAEPLLLVYRHGLSHGEVAELLEITPAAIKMRVHRAIRQLRSLLSQEEK